KSVRCADSGGPRFGRRQVGRGERVGADHFRLLRGLCVIGRIDQGHARRARLALHRIPRGWLAIERQTQDLAEHLIGILRRCKALTLTDCEIEILAVWRESDLSAELATLALWHLTPEDFESLEARGVVADSKACACEGEARPVVARLGIGEIDGLIGRI